MRRNKHSFHLRLCGTLFSDLGFSRRILSNVFSLLVENIVFSINSKRSNRKAAALVEFAICMPLLVMLVLGSVEAANAIYLRQALTIAAYEAARTASEPGGTTTSGIARANETLVARNVQDATVDISPELTPVTPRGAYVTTTVTAPLSSNLISPESIFRSRSISVTIVMVRQ